MKCQRQMCYKHIPINKKKTARYCSNECYYKVKLERSQKRYNNIIKPIKEIERNEKILKMLYEIQQLDKAISAYDLDKLGFNHGISTGEIKIDNKCIAKIIGRFAYFFQDYNKLIIWKQSTHK